MTGGQSIDLSSEGKSLSAEELEQMYALKTGALIQASVMSAACVADELADADHRGLQQYANSIGIAFQIRDDILDIEGETGVIGKPVGSDVRQDKATWPALFGLEPARERCAELLRHSIDGLDCFGERAEPLRWLAHYIVDRAQ